MDWMDLLILLLAGSSLFLFFWSLGSWGPGETRNIYDQQRLNRRRSYFLIGLFVCFVGFLGLGFDIFYLGMNFPYFGLGRASMSEAAYGTKAFWDALEESARPGFPYATVLAVLFSSLSAYWGFLNAPGMVLAACAASPASEIHPEQAQLLNVVREMATAAGIPMPKVHIVPDSDLNAFATGTSPRSAHVAVTQGLLKALNREELQGVIAHEISHIRNSDIQLMTWIVALAGMAALVCDWAFWGRRSREGDSEEGEGKGRGLVLVVWIVFALIAPIVSRLMALAVSRRREYLADASGAELTRNPLSLAKALEKIHASVSPTRSMGHQSFAHLCIDDPKGSSLNERTDFLGELLSTHPPISRRIQALKEMAYQR